MALPKPAQCAVRGPYEVKNLLTPSRADGQDPKKVGTSCYCQADGIVDPKLTPLKVFEQNGVNPMDVGCTSWDACGGDDGWRYEGQWQWGPRCARHPFSPFPTCNVEGWYYLQNTLVKTQWDPAYQASCCTGVYSLSSDLAKYCDPDWCPSDPAGKCTAIAQQRCGKVAPCGKSPLLVNDPLATNPADQFCNLWYLSVRDTDHPSKDALQNLIAQYCGAGGAGAARGECACWNAQQFLGPIPKPSPDPKDHPMLGVAGGAPGEATFRRMDVYCAGGPNTAKFMQAMEAAGRGDQAKALCGADGAGASSNAAPPASPVPAAALEALPLHCWNPDCQPNKDLCLFWDPVEMSIPCPDVCMQLSAGNRIDINVAEAKEVLLINNMLQDCEFAGPKPLGVAFQALTAGGDRAFEFCLGPDQTLDTAITLTNLASDTHWPKAGEIPYAAYSSMPSVLSITSNATGTLSNGGSIVLGVRVDTKGQLNGTNLNGEITVVDQTRANEPLHIPTLVAVTTQKCSDRAVQASSTAAPPPMRLARRSALLWIVVAAAAALALVVAGLLAAARARRTRRAVASDGGRSRDGPRVAPQSVGS